MILSYSILIIVRNIIHSMDLDIMRQLSIAIKMMLIDGFALMAVNINLYQKKNSLFY